ncbi:MAG: cytochrome ubiquinol oxidase subunit I [Polyangiaceae bacterium]|nr:cytochrome ubiquinol oxidase subunit I [Polyangiaceae bacterium]
MSEVLYARLQMAYSLGFHIVFAAIGIAMPVLMVIAEVMWLRTKEDEYLKLAKRWAKGTAVFFAVGAVSGTVLSFELGLLFPNFMKHAGPLVGLPFSLEGFAFFTEAIFLGVYLYGWDKVHRWAHVGAGVVVALSGTLSAVFVTFVNAWMNAPTGFRVDNGALVDIDPIAAMASPFAFHEILHTVLAAYMATTLAVGAIHAFGLLRKPGSTFHKRALTIALVVTIPVSLAQPLVGHHAGQVVAEHQPLKLASMEQLEKTQPGAPIEVGPVKIPGLLSFMAFNDFDATVTGLEEFPPEDRPHPIVKPSFQIMVGLGTAAAAYAAFTMLFFLRKRTIPDNRWWLRGTVALGPAGVIAMEAGWIVTEVGRQPWTIYGVMRTSEAATPVTGLWLPFVIFGLVYAGLAVIVTGVLVRQVRETTEPS